MIKRIVSAAVIALLALIWCAPAWAAFPVVAATNSSSNDTATTTATVNLPASIAANDLLIFCIGFGSTSITVTTPTNWTQIFDDVVATRGQSTGCYYKVASGSEGASVNVTITSSRW